MSVYPFFKMQAQGNDYIYFDINNEQFAGKDWSKIAIQLSERHFGIGGDGIVLILPSEKADAEMRMFNADGSEAEMCGSALRCVGFHLHQKHKKIEFTLETKAGIRKLLIKNLAEKISISAEMGNPYFIDANKFKVLEIEGYKVSVGNPHFVSFEQNLTPMQMNELGKKIEWHSAFPNRTNIDFVTIHSKEKMEIYFWERGSGNTLACGTGAIASFFSAYQLGLVKSAVKVLMPGGEVTASYEARKYWLEGEVKLVFRGEIKL
jgi:diaminopimelate epimerase